MAANTRPSGVPISRALLIRPGIVNDDFREAVAAVNRVHGDGDLPQIAVSLVGERDLGGSDGRFWFDLDPDGFLTPRAISIRAGSVVRQFAFLHEIGHFLDANGMPGAGFSSQRWSGLREWRHAIVASRAYADLAALVGTDSAVAAALLPLEELWARSYAQFVADRSGSAVLRTSLDRIRRRPDRMYYPSQWDDDDFVPIGEAVDHAFRRLRWLDELREISVPRRFKP